MSEFYWIPDFTYEPEDTFITEISKFENGAKQRRSIVDSSEEKWKLTFINKTPTIKEEIRTFFKSKKGRAISFTWTPPTVGASEITVNFDTDSVKWPMKKNGRHDFSFGFIQDRT